MASSIRGKISSTGSRSTISASRITSSSTHPSATGIGGAAPTPSSSSSNFLSSKGALPGVVIGALVFLSILAGITRRMRQRITAPARLTHLEPAPPPPPTLSQEMNNASNTVNIYNAVAPQPVAQPGYNNNYVPASLPPSPYSPGTFAPPAPNTQHHFASQNPHLDPLPNAAYHPATGWNPHPQPLAAWSPSPQLPAAWNPPPQPSRDPSPQPAWTPPAPEPAPPPSKQNYYGGGKYVLSWESSPNLDASSGPSTGPGTHSSPQHQQAVGDALPPSYEQQWRE
ncbi:hypothetical protein C8R46DRAFT_1358082 [Mycena filopes]|nr:hypothetical protein C8R46DRAFT_1358082 [Mycena filopes]